MLSNLFGKKKGGGGGGGSGSDEKKKGDRKARDDDDDDDAGDDDGNNAPLLLAEMCALLCNNEKFSDVVLNVQKDKSSAAKPFYAHKFILAASSPVFEAMVYRPQLPEDKPDASRDDGKAVQINVQADPEVFALVLQCIYSDNIAITADNVDPLMSLARKYQVEKLQVLCGECLRDDMTIETALHWFQTAPEILGDPEFGMEFVAEHMEEIAESESFMTISKERLQRLLGSDLLEVEEVVLFKACVKWGESRTKDKAELKEMLSDILPLIRFPIMELDQLAANVAPMGLLPEQHLLDLFTYNSITDEKMRENTKVKYPTKIRAGATLVRDSKILVKKHQKDMVGFFGSKKVQLNLLYRGSRDGFTAQAFHSRCDNKGASLTVVKASGRPNIFGGYVDASWVSGNNNIQAESWIFSLVNNQNRPIKFQCNNFNSGAYDNSSYGPTFGGGHDLHISNSMQSTSNYSSPSSYTQAASGYTGYLTQDLLAGAYNFTVEEIEVFGVKKK